MFKNLESPVSFIGWVAFAGGLIGTVSTSLIIFMNARIILGLLVLILGFLYSYMVAVPFRAICELYDEIRKIKVPQGTFTVSKSHYAPPANVRYMPVPEVSIATNMNAITFVQGALDFMHADGTLSYAKKHFNDLNDDAKEALSAIVPLIENNDAEGLRAVLMSIWK